MLQTLQCGERKVFYEKEMTLTGSKRPINYSVISLAEIRAEKQIFILIL